jgi:hypothetical protein
MPQKSAIWLNERPVLSTSQVAVACGIKGVGWSAIGCDPEEPDSTGNWRLKI